MIESWFKQPAKTQMIGLVSAWFFFASLTVVALSDFFRVNPFKGGHITIFVLLIISASAMWRVYKNYKKENG